MKAYVFPGQGSQHKGMGGTLFDEYAELTAKADEMLGYSIKKLCLEDPMKQLGQTQFTQPALYTVNVLTYLKKIRETGEMPDYVAGHSLGEYSALFAAGAFDFETGLKLVKHRGELMSKAVGGGMAAVLGLNEEKVEDLLKTNGFDTIDIANYNSPTQIVISAQKAEIDRVSSSFQIEGVMFIPLNVSGAFHSRFMTEAKEQFEKYLDQFAFSELTIPVIANVSARPYRSGLVRNHLADQIISSVKWTETVRYLMGKGVTEFIEIGPGDVLTKLVLRIRQQAEPLIVPEEDDNIQQIAERQESYETEETIEETVEETTEEAIEEIVVETVEETVEETAGETIKEVIEASQRPDDSASFGITALSLGDLEFKKDYNLKYAYLTGAMYRGVASKEMVVKIGKAGMMGFFGSGGLELREIEEAIQYIQKELADGQSYGMNLVHNPVNLQREEKEVEIYLRYGVPNIEVAAFMSITPALIKYRAQGLRRLNDGTVSSANKIIAKVSRPEVAEAFLSPAPERLIQKMLQENKITSEQADLLTQVPVADDLCVEADSGGHTDGGVAFAMIPAMIKLRDEMMSKYGYRKKIRVGAAGGIGAPEAAAAAFIMGADFILTGSINQCTVEAGTSDAVKKMLENINIQDTEHAPAGDMFELGAKVQVLRKGVFFPARANKLYDLYRQFNSLDEIDEKTKKQLEERYFKRSFEEIFNDSKSYYPAAEIAKAELNPKQKMAIVFRWYFGYSSRLALNGVPDKEVDYQVHCGPALGAFNQWVKGTPLESWRNRYVDEIGEKLMNETAEVLNRRYRFLVG